MSIPEIQVHYKVRYKIKGFEGEKETKAYDSYELADEHRLDIKSYDGVHSVYLLPVHPEQEN
jgi:hypothetical protein